MHGLCGNWQNTAFKFIRLPSRPTLYAILLMDKLGKGIVVVPFGSRSAQATVSEAA
jgi:hypothetical protein